MPTCRALERKEGRPARRCIQAPLFQPWVALALILESITIIGCSAPRSDRETVSLRALSFLAGPGAATREGAVEQLIARSIWAVMDSHRVLGSAVAVSATTLMVGCDVAGAGGGSVEVVRRSARRTAKLVARHRSGRLCELRPADVRLQAVRGYRPFDTVEIGEQVLAVVSRTSRSFDLVRGAIAGKGGADDPFVETSVMLPPGTRSAALFDRAGNLVAFGSAGPVSDAVVVATPIVPEAVPGLAKVQPQPIPAASPRSFQ
jgi:hypothetical protein